MRLFDTLGKNEFLRHVFTMLTGVGVAQILPLAFAPVLTRLYSPDEFGLLAIFVAAAAVLTVLATGRYEFAITQPRRNQHAFVLLILCMVLAGVFSFALFVVLVLWHESIGPLIGLSSGTQWLVLLPLSVMLVASFQALNYWSTRRKMYSRIALAKIAQSTTTVSGNLLAGGVRVPAFGLIVPHVLGQLASVVLMHRSMRANTGPLRSPTRLQMMAMAKRYRRYPLVSIWGAAANTASLQMPLFAVARVFEATFAGYFSFIYRIVGGPLALLSVAIGQVFFQTVAAGDYDNLVRTVLRLSAQLGVLAVVFVAVIHALNPEFYGFVFGASWSVVDSYAKILVFSIAVRFVVSPLSMILALNANLLIGAIWQLAYFGLLAVFLAVSMTKGELGFLTAFVIFDVAAYCVYWLLIVYAAGRNSASSQIKTR